MAGKRRVRPAPRNWYQHRALWGPREYYTKAPCQTGPNAVPKSIKQMLRGSGRSRTPIITNNSAERGPENAYNAEFMTQKKTESQSMTERDSYMCSFTPDHLPF